MDLVDQRFAVICIDHRALSELYSAFHSQIWPIFIDKAQDIGLLFKQSQLPKSILLVLSGHVEDEFAIDELHRNLAQISVEIPVVVMFDGGRPLPSCPPALRLRPAAILGAGFPLSLVALRLSDAARTALRMEEARRRRIVLGRAASAAAQTDRPKVDAGLLVVGLGGRFAAICAANKERTTIVGAFTPDMASTYLADAEFRAVMIDSAPAEAEAQIRRIRSDPRYKTLPVIAAVELAGEAPALYHAGASEVVVGDIGKEMLAWHIAMAVRAGVRRGLANRVLSAYRDRFVTAAGSWRLDANTFKAYLFSSRQAASIRGDELEVIRFAEFGETATGNSAGGDGYGSSLPDTSVIYSAAILAREEDLVAEVEDEGPVVVLRSAEAARRLGERIRSIHRSTRFS